MAGDWMKVQLSTPRKPEIMRMAEALSLDPDEVFGKCFRVWAWFDEHTEDGHARSVTFVTLNRLAGHAGFAEEMANVGWLEIEGENVKMPNFDRHNGKSAKNRALAAERKRKSRAPVTDESRSERDIMCDTSVTREEKRREEKKEKEHCAKNGEVPGEAEPVYTTKRGATLRGSILSAFESFWEAFDYKKGKASAADAWAKIVAFDPRTGAIKDSAQPIVEKIIEAARAEAEGRAALLARGLTAKYPEGWLTERRFEDEHSHKAGSGGLQHNWRAEAERRGGDWCAQAGESDAAWRARVVKRLSATT